MIRAMTLSITILSLTLIAHAQNTSKQDREKPQKQSSSMETGREGGLSGGLTIYDDGTGRQRKFKFRVAYTFDNDSGSVDTSNIPLSFNVGLNLDIPLFFNTKDYRAFNSGTPNVSSFALTRHIGRAHV